jgi:superfamily II DNA or RNA helicase
MKLWDFQEEAVAECRKRFSKHRKLILCSPTGSGKTFTACELAKLSIQKGKKVCILVDRKEILNQFIKSLAAFNLYPELVIAGSYGIRRTNLYLGMVESFDRRFLQSEALQEIDFFIFDEAHSTSYFKIIKKASGKNPFVLGLTATPILTNTKERLNDHYDDIVELAKVEKLIKDKFLCDSKTWSVDLTEARALKKSGGDFTEQSQLNAMDHFDVYQGVLENYQRICPDSPFICYNINVAHSKKMSAHFNFHGIKCKHVDGSTPDDERKAIFEMLNNGEIQGVHNFGICTTGFDEPRVSCIIQNFATDSLAKHIQTAGRGGRIAEGKDIFHILDMGMNYTRHGLWNRNKNWSDIFHNPEAGSERERKEVESVKNLNCTTCGYVINGSMENCPICDAVISDMLKIKMAKKRSDGEVSQAELKLIKSQLKDNLPPHLKDKKPGAMNKTQLKEFAGIMGYSPKWVGMQLGLRGRWRSKSQNG